MYASQTIANILYVSIQLTPGKKPFSMKTFKVGIE